MKANFLCVQVLYKSATTPQSATRGPPSSLDGDTSPAPAPASPEQKPSPTPGPTTGRPSHGGPLENLSWPNKPNDCDVASLPNSEAPIQTGFYR